MTISYLSSNVMAGFTLLWLWCEAQPRKEESIATVILMTVREELTNPASSLLHLDMTDKILFTC